MATILLVEDEPDIRELLVFTLERAGFTVVEARDANTALNRLDNRKNLPDLALIDWMLPGLSGHDLVKKLRATPHTQNIPLIMLTAKTEEADKLTGFTAGVDDYITKPFSVKELTARIKALLRRAGSPDNSRLQFGDLVLDSLSHRLFIQNKPVTIGPTEYKLLQLFMNNPNRAYSRHGLLNQVWGCNAYLGERTVDVHILRLRKVLGRFGIDSWIQTVRSVGYRFSPPDADTSDDRLD